MELDVRGEMCPYPAMKTKETLKKLQGDNLVVITDHAPALSTVPWEGAKAGFDSDIAVSGKGEWTITLKRGGDGFDARKVAAKIAAQIDDLE